MKFKKITIEIGADRLERCRELYRRRTESYSSVALSEHELSDEGLISAAVVSFEFDLKAWAEKEDANSGGAT